MVRIHVASDADQAYHLLRLARKTRFAPRCHKLLLLADHMKGQRPDGSSSVRYFRPLFMSARFLKHDGSPGIFEFVIERDCANANRCSYSKCET